MKLREYLNEEIDSKVTSFVKSLGVGAKSPMKSALGKTYYYPIRSKNLSSLDKNDLIKLGKHAKFKGFTSLMNMAEDIALVFNY